MADKTRGGGDGRGAHGFFFYFAMMSRFAGCTVRELLVTPLSSKCVIYLRR